MWISVFRRARGYDDLALLQFDTVVLDDGVEGKGTTRQVLALGAVTTVGEHWFNGQAIADGAASAAAGQVGAGSWIGHIVHCLDVFDLRL